MSAHNPDGSHPSNGVADNTAFPLTIGGAQPLLNERPMLLNPGTDSEDDRPPLPVPMYPFGHEGQGDPLFSLEPRQKG